MNSSIPAVYAAIAACIKTIGHTGISKDRRNQQQGFAFRGIDDVYNTLSSVLAANQLCIIPRVVSREVTERNTAKGGVLFYVVIDVEFDIVCAIDGSKHMARVFGEAMDSGDKATNKAMSAAYKYMALQLFCIPTEADNDADATTHEVTPKLEPIAPTRIVFEALQPEQQDYLRKIAKKVSSALTIEDARDLIDAEDLDQEHKTGLWHLLDSKTRSSLKALKEAA